MILLKGGRVMDGSVDRAADVLIEDGRIARIEPGIAAGKARVVDLKGAIVAPGFVDLHVHLREPGQEYKEDIASGARASAAGGFTTVCCMPNTTPVADNRSVIDLMVRRSREVGGTRVRPVGAITKGLLGESLAEMAEMKEAGIVAVSDDGKPVMNAGLFRRALEYAATCGLPVVQHCEDLTLSDHGVMHEGDVATKIGLRGQPWAAESVMVARDLELCELTGARYHVAHMSTSRAAALVRDGKRRGLPVTCEVTPHHLTLTDEACATYDTHCKCAPPLRTAADVGALKEALADGTIDAIATDHAPHSRVEKELEFDHAAFGMIGLETALPLVLRLVEEGVISLGRAVALLTSSPAECFSLDAGRLVVGGAADVTVFDPSRKWTVSPESIRSKSKNTPFERWEMTGLVTLTFVGGRLCHDADQRLEETR
jgi:dihydroorotase